MGIDYTTYESTCNASIEAQNITFQGTLGWTFNGTYISTNNFTIDITVNGFTTNIGSSTCRTSNVDAQNLILRHYIPKLNIIGQARVASLTITDPFIKDMNIQVDGILTLGTYTPTYNYLYITGTATSIISLCYNPSDSKDFFSKNNSSTSTGKVIYLQNSNTNAWDSNPSGESDITGSYKGIADNISTYNECINNVNFSTLLPIELTSFTAHGSEDAIHLEWEVASEKNLSDYRVEYSINGTNWREIDRVETVGPTSFNTQYNSTFTNDFPHGFVYFRLKQVSLDGSESYSKTIVLDNTISNESFKALKVGAIDILYNDHERRFVKK